MQIYLFQLNKEREAMRIIALILTLVFSSITFAATPTTNVSVPAAVDNSNTITLYTMPDKNSKVIGTIPAGQALVPIIQQQDWIKVGDPKTGNVGWMQQQSLTQKAAGISWQVPLVNQYVITEKNKDG